ncbi:MAG TPA: DNA gyrase inhibitor YacG [Candidatus Manganitrophaceae bacterium]|nr:DNA gyrase inhibitor YacG [Candidatus Manganitrophaceae bacterium]
MKVSCPICQKTVEWEGNRFRPFCSERCKLIDLGNWASESYRIPSKPEEEEEGPSGEPADGENEGPSNPPSNGNQNGKPNPP